MSVTNRVSAYIFIVILVIIVLFVIHTVLSKVKTAELFEKAQIKIVQNVFNKFPKEAHDYLDSVYDEFINDEDVINAYEAKDRDAFIKSGQKYYNKLYEIHHDGCKINMHIHFPDLTTFHRFHDPVHYGDNLKDVRPMLKHANMNREVTHGFELGLSGLFQRALFPVYKGDKYLGIAEFGLGAAHLAKDIKDITDLKTSLLVYKERVEGVVEYVAFSKIGDSYEVFNNAPELFGYMYGKSKRGKYFLFNGNCYVTIQSIPINDFQGKPLGEFILVSDRTDLLHWIIKYILVVSTLIIALIVVVNLFVRRKITPLINEIEVKYIESNRELESLNTDLEKRVELEIEKNRRNEELLHSQNKIADMGRMMNAIAHHWRQPLNSLGLYIQDVGDSYERGEIDKEYVDNFEKDSMDMILRLSATIDDFSYFFRSEHCKSKFEVVFEILSMLRLLKFQLDTNFISFNLNCKCQHKSFECNNTLKTPECDYSKTRVFGYVSEFKQAILCIVNNSIDAIAEERAKGDIRTGEIKFDIYGDDQYVKIIISDNGCGIKDNIGANIFAPYFSTKSEGKGAGLGLYMTKVIIEQHMGGNITYENREGNGVDFIIEIPVNLMKEQD